MILNQIDVGQSHPWQNPTTGQVLGSVLVEGSRTIYYPRGRSHFTQDVTFWATAWNGLGGAAAGSAAALKYLLNQLEELAGNRDLQPVYIQWTQTAQGGAPLAAAELHDGWYNISDFQADYLSFVPSGIAKCHLVVERASTPPPTRIAYSYAPANLSTTFNGSSATPQTIVALPHGSSAVAATRTGGDGTIPVVQSPVTNPLLIGLSTTVSDWWKGGCHVFDTLNTGSNPVPTAGTFVNANWVEVEGADHYYQGDCVVTNGLLLFLYQTTVGSASIYVWNTALGPPAWQLVGSLQNYAGATLDALLGYSLDRAGMEEVASKLSFVNLGAGGWGTPANTGLTEVGLRLLRGAYLLRIAMTSYAQSYAGATTTGLRFVQQATTKLILWNSGGVSDSDVDSPLPLTAVSDYGYAGLLLPNASSQYILTMLWQNKPPTNQPYTVGQVLNGYESWADGPAANGTTYFGFGAVPFATTVNLQAEAESGTLGTGWSNVVDAAASAGHTAKAASGTASTNADLFGTSWVPPAGAYDVWFRVKVTSAAGSAAEMTLGLWDATSSAFVPNGSTTFKANQASTSYVWLKANTTSPLTPTASHNMQFRAVTAATLGTDWFLDEAVLVPITLTTGAMGPRDLFQQYLGDVGTRPIRL